MPSDRQRSYIRFRLSRRALLALAPVVLSSPHIAGLTNAFDILVASAFFLLASLLLLPRLLWPLLNRPLHAIATHIGVRKRLFLAVGLILLSFAYGKVPEWLQEILKSLVGG